MGEKKDVGEIGMWLVIVRTTMDDLPIQLCDSYAEAREVADWITQAQCDEAEVRVAEPDDLTGPSGSRLDLPIGDAPRDDR